MKKLIILTALILLSGNAFANEPARIAVVDMQKLSDLSTASIGIKEQAKKERDKYQASISKEEEQLRKEEAKLQEQRTILTSENFAEKSRQFKDKVAKVQRDFQEKRAAQEEMLKKSFDQVNRVTYAIIDDLAKEEGFDITIPASQIFYYDKKFDITEKVLVRLNEKLPQLQKTDDSKPKAKSEKTSSDKGKTTSKKKE